MAAGKSLMHFPTTARAVLVQYPDVFGAVGDLRPWAEAAHAAGALLIVAGPPKPSRWVRSGRPAKTARTLWLPKDSRSAWAWRSADRTSACSLPGTSTCGTCRGGSPVKRWTPRANAHSC